MLLEYYVSHKVAGSDLPVLTTQPPPPAFLFLAHTLAWPQEDELEARAAKINQLGRQVASEGRQRAEERRGRTEAERRLRAEKQVSAHAAMLWVDSRLARSGTGIHYGRRSPAS